MTLKNVPPEVQTKLDTLRDDLVAGLGDKLAAIVAFGSAVRGGYVPGRSDVDLIVVLEEDDRELLETIGPPLLLARTSARIESVLMTKRELARAADVFPLLYDDVRNTHHILHGDDPFAGLTIADTHRRLRIEQELRDARIRLRLVLSEASRLPRGLRGAVARKVKQLRSPVHALLILKDQAPPDDGVEAVMRGAAKAYEVDAKALLRFEEAPEAAYDALTQLLDAAIADVDTMEVGG